MKILFLYENNKCYDSFKYFTECIKNEFDTLGYETDIVPVGDRQDAVPDLMKLYGSEYDYVIDVAGAFLNKKDPDGDYCYNHIKGQKIHYVIDHPLYLRKILSCPLKGITCICIDEYHAGFIKQYYPNVENVYVNPLGGSRAKNRIPWAERENNLLFCGTYSNPELIIKKIKSEDARTQLLFEKMSALMLDEPSLTQEAALKSVCHNLHVSVPDSDIPILLEKLYLVDVYLRAVIREEIILACLRKKIDIDVYGFGWELFLKKLSFSDRSLIPYIHLKGQVDYEKTSELFSKYKYVLNHMPWFKNGLHDRVPMAVMNGCTCFTDPTEYLDRKITKIDDDFSHEKNNKKNKKINIKNKIIFYSVEDMDAGADLIKRTIDDDSEKNKKINKNNNLFNSEINDDAAADIYETAITTEFSWTWHVNELVSMLGIKKESGII